MVTLFLVQIQIWWAFFDMRADREWNFFSFLYSLAIPVIGYLLCYLVVPALDPDTVEIRANYHENRGWFLGLVVHRHRLSKRRSGLTTAADASRPGTCAVTFERSWWSSSGGSIPTAQA